MTRNDKNINQAAQYVPGAFEPYFVQSIATRPRNVWENTEDFCIDTWVSPHFFSFSPCQQLSKYILEPYSKCKELKISGTTLWTQSFPVMAANKGMPV